MKTKNILGIIPKHSSVKDKLPTSAQLETAEVAVNINADAPFISVKCNDGTVKKLGGEGFKVVSELPATGETGIQYVLVTEIAVPGQPVTYEYDLYLYENAEWHILAESVVEYTAGENITISPAKEISADQVRNITQADYDALAAESALSKTAIYNIVDKPILNVDDYQKKLIAGDGITIDAVNNIIDCTLDSNLYIVVDALPSEGVENKIYLLKVVNPDTTVSFNQYGWINDAWVNYGQTSSLTPNVSGSGVTIDSTTNAINAKLGNGLTFDANSAITANLGGGLTMDGNKIVPNIAAPIVKNASNQLTVSSSSTYTSTGSEMFTRAGAYNMYNAYLVPKAVTLSPNTSVVDTSQFWWSTAYQVGKLVVVNASFGIKADAAAGTLLVSNLPIPQGTDVSVIVGDTYDKYTSPCLQVTSTGTLVVRSGYSLTNGHYYAGTFTYVCQ